MQYVRTIIINIIFYKLNLKRFDFEEIQNCTLRETAGRSILKEMSNER
jgi:hypothetical protein